MADSQKRKEILEAASLSFARFGFAKTTMDDIGRLVGLNKASLYYYYKNKEAIFCEIIENEGAAFLACLKNKIRHIEKWDEKIQAYLLERQQYLRQTANLHSLSVKTADQLRFQPIFRELAGRFAARETNLIAEILDRTRQAGFIRRVDNRKTAAIILCLADSLKNEQLDLHAPGFPDNTDFKALEADTRFAVALILEGLKVKDLN